jgi:site-specific DNA-cytosine methylase
MSEKKGLNVVSYFNGMNCGMLALDKAEIKVNNYYSYEIDKYANLVSQKNYPNTKQMGSVVNTDLSILPKIDVLIGGSPCQGFSFAGKQLNFEDPRSKLFFDFVKAKNFLKPKYFLLENVKMKKEQEQVITKLLGVEPIEICSSLVSAQERKRLYWTNIPNIKQPKDKSIFLNDIIKPNSRSFLSEKTASRNRTIKNTRLGNEKSGCILATSYKLAQANGMTNVFDGGKLRCLSPLECERLQNVPDNYTDCVSNTQRYKMLGNGWTVDVIAHIFKGLSKPTE